MQNDNEISKKKTSMIEEYLNSYPNSLKEYEFIKEISQSKYEFVFKMKPKKLTKYEFILLKCFSLSDDRHYVKIKDEVWYSFFSNFKFKYRLKLKHPNVINCVTHFKEKSEKISQQTRYMNYYFITEFEEYETLNHRIMDRTKEKLTKEVMKKHFKN